MSVRLLLIIGSVGLLQTTVANEPCKVGIGDNANNARCNDAQNADSPASRTIYEMLANHKTSKFTSGDRRAEASRALQLKLLQKHEAISQPGSNQQTTTIVNANSSAESAQNNSKVDTKVALMQQQLDLTNSLHPNDLKKMKAIAMAVANAPGNPFESLPSDRLEKIDDKNSQDKNDNGDDNLDTFRFSNFEEYKGNMDDDKETSAMPTFSAFSERAATSEPSVEEIMSYCMEYDVHYKHYCLKPVERSPTVERKLFHFCPSFEKHCPQRAARAKLQHRRRTLNTASSSTVPWSSFASSKKHPVPCTPDCDQRIWPHCTAECKCDYIYPIVQRFCNPPPIPFFLNTCRLWYAGCPKYHRYHYTSQYFVSQANKDRISPVNNPVTPYGIMTSNPAGFGTLGALPMQRDKVAKDAVAKSGKFGNQKRNDEGLFTEHLHSRTAGHQSSAGELEFHPDDYIDTEDEEFHKFDQLSEAALTYQPRHLSSIYTKPGLWDANPGNPHNRDHANKYWYNPKSVEADWMHGQVTWGGHWAVPAFGVGGSDGYSAVFFPSIGQFLGIEDDYDA